ncbi:MAG: DNA replication and repair protein RecF [Bdellovibrionota bacterium]
MKIEEVFISDFRNLKDIPYLSTSKINAFIGDNAQGKTNFLESLYATLRGESFRYYSSKKDWRSSSANALGVRIRVQSNLGNQHQVEMKLESQTVRFLLNEKRIPASQLKIKHPIVVFSPDDHQLVRGEPEERRRYVEDVLSDGVPGYSELLYSYQKALKNRNILLKVAREKGLQKEIKNQIQHWDALLAREGVALLQLREESWPEYKKVFEQVIHEIFHTTRVDMKWKVFQKIPTESEYVDNLGISFEKDFYTARTNYGPHREDFELLIGDVSARSSASQGQARVLAMGLRWSHAQWIRERNMEDPLFFVDDFSSELDEHHRKALLERLFSSEGQVFLTGTKEAFLESNGSSNHSTKMFAKIPKSYIVNGKILDRDFIG